MTDEQPRRRKRRPILTVLLVLAALPIGGVLIHTVAPPPLTLLMAREFVAGHGLDYRWRSLDQISPHLVASAIAAEDARFCSHGGFDMQAIERALKNNENGRKVRGGSTISQQTAKNVFLWPQRDWVRKGLETWFTVLIELGWGKERIMEVYLNSIEWGPGVYGAEAAAQRNFRVPAAKLTAAQAYRLAAIIPKPLSWKAAKPGPYIKRRSGSIGRNARVVRNDGLAGCVL